MADPHSHSSDEPGLPEVNLEEIFHHALEFGADERDQYLARACGNESALRAELECLLSAYQDAEGGALLKTGELEGFGERAACEIAERVAEEHRAAFIGAEQPGDWIDRYHLLEKIGEGGFGVVWMAEQREPVRRRVALKIVKPGMDTKQVIARFEQERQALALMEHPNIARVFDAGSTPAGRPYFVMELVRGIKITGYCDQARLPTSERLRLFLSVCDAVQHAHQKGIIHRDLKPSNILVTLHDGVPVPKVIDFGVAKAIRQDPLTELTLFTRFDEMIGTPLYMSPEQAEMSGFDVDTRSDIYSLGVLLYELMTGRTPVDPDSLARAGLAEVRRIIREGLHPRPSALFTSLGAEARTTAARNRDTRPETLLRGLNGDLDWIIMKALERDRNRRYESAHLLAADLECYLTSEPVTARPPSAWYQFQCLIRRHKVASVTASLVTVILLAGIALSLILAERAEIQSDRANRTLASLRDTAPAFATQARSFHAAGDYEGAISQLDYAIKLRPDLPDYRLSKAGLLMARFRFGEAAECFREVLVSFPQNARAAAAAPLCEKLHRETGDRGDPSIADLIALHALMRDEGMGDAEMAMIRSRLTERTRGILTEITGGDEGRFGELEDGTWRLDLRDLPVSDLSPLHGLMISWLRLHGTLVSDLTPLAGMPLDYLQLHHTKVENLDPLRGMPLRTLCLPDGYVGDLAILMDCDKLEQLHLPIHLANAFSLRDHTSLKRVSKMDPTKQPKAHFLAGELIRKGRYREAQSLLEMQTASESYGTYSWAGLMSLLSAHGNHQELAGLVRARIKGLASRSDASVMATHLALHSLLPNPPALPIEEIEPLLQMAENESSDWSLLTQGLLAYRKGDFEKVIEILDPQYLQMEGTSPAMAASILTMARCRLGDLAGADELLAKSTSPWTEGIDTGWLWHNWMVHDKLRREAENLLEAGRERSPAE